MRQPRRSQLPRAIASRIVRSWMTEGEYPTQALANIRRNHGIILEIVHGVMRQFRVLEFYRSSLVPRQPNPRIDSLLMTGLYQLLFLDRTEEHAVVHETVEIAKKDISEGAGRLVNATLRRALRERDELQAALLQQPAAVRLSHPDVLFDRWLERFGQADTEVLCEWNNRRAEVVIRINALRTTVEDYLHKLKSAKIDAVPHPFRPDAFITLPSGARVRDLPGYKDGDFFVQDPATSVALDLLQVQPGHRLLDLCAAPGGKTLVLAEALKGDGLLVASDLRSDRLEKVRENLDRLGHRDVAVVRANATDPDQLHRALKDYDPARGFDRILLDVPCSNTGVLRRRPDARWRFTLDDLPELVALQRALLDTAAGLVADGGCLVYSTCSLEPEENGGLIQSWLQDHPDWIVEEERELTPGANKTDGAYAVRLRRTP